MNKKKILKELVPYRVYATTDLYYYEISENKLFEIFETQSKKDKRLEREEKILTMIERGFNFREIGERLCLSKQRVHQIYKNINK